jgi:hypothetical protein
VDGKEVSCEAVYCEKTLTVSLSVIAKTSESIELKIEGENLVTDNGDIGKKIEKLLTNSKLSILGKTVLLDAAKFPNYVPLDKYRRMFNQGHLTLKDKYVVEAIKEQLTLDKDIFDFKY